MVSPVIYFADTPTNQNLHWSFNEESTDYEEYLTVTVLGFLEATFEPIDVRMHYQKIQKPLPSFSALNILSPTIQSDDFADKIIAIEAGRRIAIGTHRY